VASSGAYDCTPTIAGTFGVLATATDTNGATAKAVTPPVVVFGDPSVSLPGFAPPVGDVGVPMNGTVWAAGGSGSYRYIWAGLPGCSGVNATIRCPPTLEGTFNVSVTVIDSNGYSVTSDPVAVGVNPAMSVSMRVPNGTQSVGAALAFSTFVSGGTTPYVTTWVFGDHSEAGGTRVTHAYSATGAYGVQLWVNDSAGGSVYREFAVLVSPPPSIWSLSNLEGDLPFIGALAILVVGVALALAWRPQPPPPKVRPRRAPVSSEPVRKRAKPPAPSWDDPSGWE
ncbi:MAG TPA: PKD domain-containing protein, partial [Thermoplasmata archaeon]|nr:PKD domain-containing protein [Thermoplasmata archaeon]